VIRGGCHVAKVVEFDHFKVFRSEHFEGGSCLEIEAIKLLHQVTQRAEG